MSRPRVLLLADQPCWAYHMIAKYVAGSLRDSYDFYIDFAKFYVGQRRGNRSAAWSLRLRNRLEQWRWSRSSRDGRYDVVVHLGWYFDAIADLSEIRSRRVVKGLYTQGFPPQGMERDPRDGSDVALLDRAAFVKRYLADSAVVVCGAPVVQCQWAGALAMPSFYANLALDEAAYSPIGHRQAQESDFVVGWTGNPDRPFKGYYSHVVPAVEKAARLRPGIRLKSRFSGPPETLPDFYKDVDVVLIASDADAGPSMFLEAALSGVPAVSTRVGIVGHVLRDGENGIEVPRDADAMAQALVQLHDDRAQLSRLAGRIRPDTIALVGDAVQRLAWQTVLQAALDAPAA